MSRFEEIKSAIDYEAGVLQLGNLARMKQFQKKAEAGEPVTVAFLGGSITQGCLSSTPKTCYAYLTYAWLQERFPKANMTYHNAGIGATTSHLGVARLKEDVLALHPDLLVIEFSVNDEDDSAFFKETYEGLVRAALQASEDLAVVILHNVRYDDGGNAEEIHRPIARQYELPEVSVRSSLYPLVKAGKVQNREITQDDLHPNDLGHALVASILTYGLEKTFTTGEAVLPISLPAPLTKNRYEQAIRYRQDTLHIIESIGFVKDETKQESISDCFKKGFMAREKGDYLIARGTFSQLAIQYRKTVRKPAPIATLWIDGQKQEALLDANFTEDWGDCLYLQNVAEDLPYTEHTVRLELSTASLEDKEGFYLVSFITA